MSATIIWIVLRGEIMREFIHYGHKEFNPKMFVNITNRILHSKPNGGLWASDINAKYGWKDWCEETEFRECHTDNSFAFCLTPCAKILTINSVKDLEVLPVFKEEIYNASIWCSLDFGQIARNYDVIEVNISEDSDLYYKLYGWDCDSIVVTNPNVIVVKSK